MFDFNHPFFKPLWLRLAVTLVALGWAAFEYVSGSPGWAMLFAAIGLYAGYGFFVNFKPRDEA